MRIKSHKQSEEFKNIDLPEIDMQGENLAGISDALSAKSNGLFLKGNFQSPNFVKGKKGWKIDSDGNASFIGINTEWINVGNTDGKKPDDNADITQTELDLGASIDNAKANGSTFIVGGYIRTGIISCDNITVGTLPTSRTAAQCTDADADQTSANTSADTAKVQGYTLISDGYISTGRITCDNITAGTLTGRTVQTSSSGKRVVLASDKISIYDTSNNLVGTIEGWQGVSAMDINWGKIGLVTFMGNVGTSPFGVGVGTAAIGMYGSPLTNLFMSARKMGGGGGNIMILAEIGSNIKVYNSIIPQTDISYSLGSDSKKFLTLKSKYAQITASVTIAQSASPLADNGTIYFNGSHFYGRISGAWVQLDN